MHLSDIVINAYDFILFTIALYSFHRLLIIWRLYRCHHLSAQPCHYYSDTELPKITVQLPIFNEMYVVKRLLQAVSQLNYPADKLEIQVLDDSTDETNTVCQQEIQKLKEQHLNIQHIQRQQRQGFKAGALKHGLTVATGELVAIFDADFVPQPDTLLKMVHYFSDPKVGMVQARWDHLNRHYSTLTELQALMLDAHFLAEQTSRSRTGCFFNFNGTAGMWRMAAITDAGGWQHSTVTEDLDLSYRAQLRGWRCIYLPDIGVPAELPMEMNSFKSQQFRWAKGSSQVAKRLLPSIWHANLPAYIKWEAFFHLTNNFNYLLMMVLLILSLPYQLYVMSHSWQYALFFYVPLSLTTSFSLITFYVIAQRQPNGGWFSWRLLRNLFLLMGVGIGLSINQSLAVCDGLLRNNRDFVRTPKHGVIGVAESWVDKKYRAAKNWVPYMELVMVVYLVMTIAIAITNHHYLSLPFLILFLIGYAYTFSLSVFQTR
ncbi:glycosyltransferase [Leptolyngbya cf. ectocarpi LEGE 11479]|uniref:Glycosyltransferase n=1 Tax=Leptolyngbya cf. ectocarpi LEGE 11479 TaxID=1828722 RepID=A0A929FCJ3_LEPEC|nr:glycosyltransferase [Leptolyngbya ectocarpi]MBE9070059.1 glycosyltransferase [Leptolyngbya cf. ectocarpi LEGE 11479]